MAAAAVVVAVVEPVLTATPATLEALVVQVVVAQVAQVQFQLTLQEMLPTV